MASSDNSTSPLEKQIAKKLAEYIDRAITAPPKHQPFIYYNEYDVFLQNMEAHTTGIDMKQVYEAKSSDPSWVKEHDDYSINLARLFLAVGERDSYASIPGSSPSLSLGSVDLKYIFHKRFKDILFHIANANERAVNSRPPKDPEGCDRVFEESTKKTFNINIHQPYPRQADDPHWMQRYSNMAINVVRLSLAIKAIPAPRNRARPRPPARVKLESVSLKDVTQQAFLEHLNGFFDSLRRARERAVLNNTGTGAAAPANVGGQANPPSAQSQAQAQAQDDDGDDEEEHGYEGDDDAWEDEDENGDVPDDIREFFDNLSDDSSDSDSEVSSDDLFDDDLSLFETDEERDELFANWSKNEKDESLPIDVIGPLLEDPNTRNITVNLFITLLGVSRAPKKELMKDVKTVLREQRKMYRIAHTRPFLLEQIPEYKRPVTPFLGVYSGLARAAYVMRRIPAGMAIPELIETSVHNLEAILEDLKYIVTEDLLPDSRAVIAERGGIARIRMRTCLGTFHHIHSIENSFLNLFTTKGSARMPIFIVNPSRAAEMLAALEQFKQFDQARLGKKYFKEFPGCLVKPFKIMKRLNEVIKLRKISEFRRYQDVLKAVDIATELWKKWHERSLDDHNSLFAPMRY